MQRWILRSLCVLSLLIFLGSAVIWARGYSETEVAFWRCHADGDELSQPNWVIYGATWSRGIIMLGRMAPDGSSRAFWRPGFYYVTERQIEAAHPLPHMFWEVYHREQKLGFQSGRTMTRDAGIHPYWVQSATIRISWLLISGLPPLLWITRWFFHRRGIHKRGFPVLPKKE